MHFDESTPRVLLSTSNGGTLCTEFTATKQKRSKKKLICVCVYVCARVHLTLMGCV